MLMDEEIDVDDLANLLDDHPSTFVGATDEENNTGAVAPAVAAPETQEETVATEDAVEEDEGDARAARKKARKEERRKEKEDRRMSKKLRKEGKEKRSRFIDDAASEGTEDEEDEHAERGELPDDVDEPAYIKNHKKSRHLFREGDEEMTNEEMAREIEERNKLQTSRRKHLKQQKLGGGASMGAVQQASHHHHDPTVGHLDMVPQRIPLSKRFSYLPQATDPKVFAVKCKSGMGRLLVTRLVNKCYHFRIGLNDEKKKIDLGIVSAFALEHAREYIYVEAHRQLFVEQALNGLVGVYRYNIKMVNPNELMQLLEPRPSHRNAVRVGTFVRVKSQKPYQGDLAQVMGISTDGKRAELKIVPREDFVNKKYNKASAVRNPRRFFDPNLAVGVQDSGDEVRWGDLVFDAEGYLKKSISLRGVISGDAMVTPTTEELAFFLKGKRDQIMIASNALAAATSGNAGGGGTTTASREFKLGEVVRVGSGQLMNTVGTIVDVTISTNTVKIACRVPGRAQPFEVRTELSNCERHFVSGNHIGVESGTFSGRTGTVIKVLGGGLLAVLADNAGTEFEVRASDCRQSRLLSTAKHTLGAWRLFDLVMLVDGTTVGCIVKCTATSLHIVTTDNMAQTVSPSEVKTAVKTSRSAVDRMHNAVVRGAVVTILDVTDRVQAAVVHAVGSVEQLFDQTLFVRCPKIATNSGIVAIPATLVQLVGGKTTTKAIVQPKQLPVVEKKGHYAKAMRDVVPTQEEQQSAQWNEPSVYYMP